MNKDELIKKLESMEFPDAAVESHRLKLRQALTAAIAVRGLEKETTFWDNIRSGFDNFGVLLQRPALKMAFSTGVAIVVFLSLFLAYRLSGEVSPTVLASNIALENPDVPGMLEGTGDIRVLNVNIKDDTAHVICGRNVGNVVQIDIDLKSRTTLRAQRLAGLFMSELNETLKSDAIKIAIADPRVRQMISQGGNVKRVMPSLSSISSVGPINDDILKILSSNNKVIVQMECGGKNWLIQTNLSEHQVDRIVEPQMRTTPVMSLNTAVKPS